MSWWLWALFGLLLLAIEMAMSSGLYALFFGVGALLVSALVGIGVGGPSWFQWLLFSVLSIIALLVFRSPLLARIGGRGRHASSVDTLVGEIATLLEDLSPGAFGKAELRGTTWNVCNRDTQLLHKGQPCRVQRVDGLTLTIRAV